MCITHLKSKSKDTKNYLKSAHQNTCENGLETRLSGKNTGWSPRGHRFNSQYPKGGFCTTIC